MPTEPDGYALLDVGVRRRLERFGALTIDRPAPSADDFRQAPELWAGLDLRFDAGAGWSGPAWPAEPWPITIDGLAMELRPTASGGLGCYPEHAANLAWLARQVTDRVAASTLGAPPLVLNLFAHTGLATLALARAGAAVVHVDGAKSAVDWARRNASLSGLQDLPIRWLVDDAAAFVAREARRGRQYDGIALDPPAFGRASGREWRLEKDLPALLQACRTVAAQGAFVLLTAHSDSIDGSNLAAIFREGFGRRATPAAAVAMDITADSGAVLRLGWAMRSEA